MSIGPRLFATLTFPRAHCWTYLKTFRYCVPIVSRNSVPSARQASCEDLKESQSPSPIEVSLDSFPSFYVQVSLIVASSDVPASSGRHAILNSLRPVEISFNSSSCISASLVPSNSTTTSTTRPGPLLI
ncbi:hypothetical protein CC80DRAFT_37671 [Byssothecium circinans]|uniref:Uncharacterized protein n=1 Tax=Byssothecium circinans TaxID=147558 RepID=A0A6A5U050_9PLEO|nr:hypothetical protein CC80DRAFT_37671 [Byssothecium circinans]